MSTALLDLIDTVLKEAAPNISWHETTRRDFGLSDETDGEALLCLTVTNQNATATTLKRASAMAFVIDDVQVKNTLLAVAEFTRELFHPLTGAPGSLVTLDFLPPMEDGGKARGISRRWVLDKTNQQLVLPELKSYLSAVAKGL